MKNCHSCKQPLAEGVRACPLCGAEIPDGPAFIGNYRIISAVREGYASLLYRATPVEGGDDVLIRLFKLDARMDEEKAARPRGCSMRLNNCGNSPVKTSSGTKASHGRMAASGTG